MLKIIYIKSTKKNRVKYEWFDLDEKDVDFILKNYFDNPSLDEISYLDFKITHGKYKGRYLCSMFSKSEIKWLSSFDNYYYNDWCMNFGRYSFLKEDIDKYFNKTFSSNKVNEFKDIEFFYEYLDSINHNIDFYKKNKILLEGSKAISIIRKLGKILNLQTISDYAKENNMSYNGVKKHRNIITLFGVKFVLDNE